jgi:formylmethanofuran dehydrogenase subunit E
MLQGRDKKEKVELVCPECHEKVTATLEEAQAGKVRCKRGHEVVVMGILGGPGGL